MWLRLKAPSSAHAEGLGQRIHDSLARARAVSCWTCRSSTGTRWTTCVPPGKAGGLSPRIRLIVPKLSAAHPELILLASMFQHYRAEGLGPSPRATVTLAKFAGLVKSEAQRPKSERNPKSEVQTASAHQGWLQAGSFSDFGLLISDLCWPARSTNARFALPSSLGPRNGPCQALRLGVGTLGRDWTRPLTVVQRARE